MVIFLLISKVVQLSAPAAGVFSEQPYQDGASHGEHSLISLSWLQFDQSLDNLQFPVDTLNLSGSNPGNSLCLLHCSPFVCRPLS